MRHYLYVFMLLLASIYSCSTHPMVMEEQEEMDTIKTYSYLALGDSYTIGQGVSQVESWPVQLKDSLLANYRIALEPLDIIARTGWTTANLIDQINSTQPKVHDLVSLLIGVNNQFQGGSFEIFKMEFDTLLNTAFTLSTNENRVFVVSIPDYGVTPFGMDNATQISAELDMYNNYMNSKCIEKNIPFINITEISRLIKDGEMALASDDLHPSGFQYSKWIEEIMPVVYLLLE